MYWFCWLTVFLTPSLIASRFVEGKVDPGCKSHETHGDAQFFHCHDSSNVTYDVLIQPSVSVNITCDGNLNWTDFLPGMKGPIKDVREIYFNDCNIPKKGFAAVTKQLLTDEVSSLFFQSSKNRTSLTRETFRGLNNLRKLELPFNNLLNLTEDLLKDLRNLTYLNLEGNNLEEVPENFFRNSSLRDIFLQSNQLKTFKNHTFDLLVDLRRLYISNNSLKNLLPYTFEELTSLVSLNMSDNFLESLPEGIFKKMQKLDIIELSRNNFTKEKLPENLFKDNVELRVVFMDNNKRNMTSFPNGFFANLTSLQIVSLEKNGLINLPENLFWGTKNLSYVSIGTNFLNTLPSKIFKDTTKMCWLDLSFNNLSDLPEDIFENLKELKYLDLSVNHFTRVSEKLFAGLESLRELRMNRNGLKTIEVRAFYSCTEFKKVHLSPNNVLNKSENWQTSLKLKSLDWLYNLPQFSKIRDLQSSSQDFKVNLDNNNVTSINFTTVEAWAEEPRACGVSISIENNPIHCDCRLYDFLRYLEKNITINVNKTLQFRIGKSKCHGQSDFRETAITDLRSKTFKCNVSKPDLAAECLDKCKYDMHAENNTLIVDCAYKDLMEAPPKLDCLPNRQIDHIELNLTGNLLKKIPDLAKNGYNKVTVLMLGHNNISNVTFNGLPNFSPRGLKVNLDFNNVTYINVTTLEAWAADSRLRGVSISIENNPIQCDCRLYDFIRYLEKNITMNVNKTLQFRIGKSKCHGPSDFRETAIADLRSKTFKCNVNKQDLGAECSDKCNYYMRAENNTLIVDCSYKGLMEAPRKVDCLSNYRIDYIELNLTGNYLTKMPDLDKNGYNNVTVLMLEHNNISSVTVNGLSNKLEVLKLNNNSITWMSSDAINFLKNATTLRTLTLEANPWLCDCGALDFINFIQEKVVSNSELFKVQCNGFDSSITKMKPEELCPTETVWTTADSLMVIFAALILGTLIAIYYRYREEIKVWLYFHRCCSCFGTKNEYDRDNLYDTSVRYTHQDEEFVENYMLEQGSPL